VVGTVLRDGCPMETRWQASGAGVDVPVGQYGRPARVQ